MFFNVGTIRTAFQQLDQKLTPVKIHQFWTKVRATALTKARKVRNTYSKISDVGTKLLPMAQTAATVMRYGPEVLGFESARKGLGRYTTSAQIKPKYDWSDVYDLNSLLKGQYFFSRYK